MKTIVSLSAARITAELLIRTMFGTAHAGMQKFSNVGGRDVSWNFVKIESGRTVPVLAREDASGIVCGGKYYKLK